MEAYPWPWGLPRRNQVPVDPVMGTKLGECPGVPPRDLGYAPQERGVRRGGNSKEDVEIYFIFFFAQAQARQRPGAKPPRQGREGRDPGVFRQATYTSSYGKA